MSEEIVAACYTCRNESDIVECSIRHTLAEDVDLILIADGRSTDGTREILDRLKAEHPERILWIDDPEPVHYQPMWTQHLADMAAERGATWIICCDIDEFVYSPDGRTIKQALQGCPHQVLAIQKWNHHDWNTKIVPANDGPKVAYRYRPGVVIANGNHYCSLGTGVQGVLEMRELQHRSFAHLRRKARERTETLDPVVAARGDGAYHPLFNSWSDEELRAWWDGSHARPSIVDPIPSRTNHRPIP